MFGNFEYDKWNEKKQYINFSRTPNIYLKEREVWWCSIGLNVGFEENGKGSRFNTPVLILKKYGPQVFIGALISNTQKTGSFYYRFLLKGRENACLLTQIRLFDARRLTQKIGTLGEEDFQNIRKAVKDLL